MEIHRVVAELKNIWWPESTPKCTILGTFGGLAQNWLERCPPIDCYSCMAWSKASFSAFTIPESRRRVFLKCVWKFENFWRASRFGVSWSQYISFAHVWRRFWIAEIKAHSYQKELRQKTQYWRSYQEKSQNFDTCSSHFWDLKKF